MSNNKVCNGKMTNTQPKRAYKSWAVMADEADEEERLEKEENNREKYRKIVKQRLYLLSIGQYELEDGEILE
jgi:hypothetical protein